MFCCFRYNFMWTVGHQTTQLFHICCLCCSTSDNTNYSKHHSCQTVELQACTILWYELAHYMIKLVYLIEEIMIKALWVKKKWVPGHQVFYFFFHHCIITLTKKKLLIGQWNWSVSLPRYISHTTLTYRAGCYIFYTMRCMNPDLYERESSR